MGMYTEIFVNVDLKEETPAIVIMTLQAMCDKDTDNPALADKPNRWGWLFCDGSHYTPLTEVAKLTFNNIANQYSLIGKGDIKNYGDEIEQFFKWITPHVDTCGKTFIGYSRYEECDEPTLYYAGEDDEEA